MVSVSVRVRVRVRFRVRVRVRDLTPNPIPIPNPNQVYGNQTAAALAAMPGGRCPLPPGDVPGGGLGFDREGHWVGEQQGAAEMARLRRLERER